MKIFYATSGERKFDEIKDLIPEQLEIKQISSDYPEIQADDTDDVALFGAEWLAKKLNKAVFVDDMGMFIDALDGFPGPFTKQACKKIKPEGILRLLEGIKDRKAFFKVSLGFCEPGKKPVVFSGIRKGRISEKIISGPSDIGLNSVFIPEGCEKTLAQFSFEEKLKDEPRRTAFKKLVSSLKML